MHPSVQAAFLPFNTKFEGYLPYLYLDNEGLVTTGMGNLVDPIGEALSLPWRNPDGSLTSQSDIAVQWNAVKNSGESGSGGGNQAHLTTMRLDDAGIRALIAQKLGNMEAILKGRIPQWDSLPADAQLGILSMSWAMGPSFQYPKFLAAINQVVPDFASAIDECWMPDNSTHSPNDNSPSLNPGLRPRNLANRRLFKNAETAISSGLNTSQLLYDLNTTAQQLLAGGINAVNTGYAVSVASAQLALKHPWRTGAVVVAGGLAAGGLSWYLTDKNGMLDFVGKMRRKVSV